MPTDYPPTDCQTCATEGVTRDADGYDHAGDWQCAPHLARYRVDQLVQAAPYVLGDWQPHSYHATREDAQRVAGESAGTRIMRVVELV